MIECWHPLASITYLCDLAGPEPRLQATFGNLSLLTHDGSHLAAGNQLSGLAPLFAFIANPAERPKIQLFDLGTMQPKDVCQLSRLDGGLAPLAFAPDDRTLAVHCSHVFPPGKEWYKPVFEPDRAVHVYDIASGRRLARLPGRDAIFTPDGLALIAPGDGAVRVYGYPVRTPLLAIILWAMPPTAVVILLSWLSRAPSIWKRWRQPPSPRLQRAPAP